MKTANVSKRLFAALLAVLMFVGMLPFGALSFTAQAADVTGASLASVPAVRGDVTSASGAFTLTSQSRFYIVSDTDPTGTALGTYVQTASSEFAAEGKPVGTTLPIVYGAETNAAEGDIVIKVDASLGKSEMYNLTVTSSNIEITASDAAGVLHALHTVLQSLVNGSTNSLACVTASDWPDVSERSVYLDCGRIFFSVDSVKAMIRTLSWNKMNVLYLDFSNNNATRFFLNNMDVTVDGTTYDITKAKPSDGYWNEDNMDEILAEAYKYGVEIIPTFNSPGHIGGLRSVNTSFFGSKSATDYDSGTGKVALNISNDASYSFGQQVVKLYVDYFYSKGCKNFNIAADEATDAIDGLDSTGSVFVKYVNDLNTYIKSKGMKARMFNDAIKSVDDGISSDITVLYWAPSTPSPEDLVLAGYDVVNFDWEYLYYAHGASDYWNCNVSKMYAWNPGAFKDSTTASGYNADYNSGKQPAYSFSSNNSSHGKIVGANFAIWTDFAHTANQAGEDVLKEKSCKYQSGSYGLRYKIYILGERGWSRATDSVAYNTWKAGVINAPAGLDVSTGSFGTSSSLPTAQEITAASIPVEIATLIDESTGITVSAPGIVKLVVTSKEARTISNAAAVRTYDITAYTDDGVETAYQGEATVSFPIPSEWDLSKVVAYGITDGQVEFINGAFDGTTYTIKVSHFSEYGLVLLDITVPEYVDGTVSSSGTTDEYTRVTSISAGEYIIVPTTATTVALGYDGNAKAVSVSGSGNNMKLTLGTGVSESNVMWTFTGSGTSYAIKIGNYNLYPTSSYYDGTSVVSTTYSGDLTVSARSTNYPEQFLISRTARSWTGNTTYYLRYSSGFTVTTNTNSGRYFYLFKKTSTAAYTVNTTSLEELIAYAKTLNSESYSNWDSLGVSDLITAAEKAVSSTINPYSTENAATLQQNTVNTAGKNLYEALKQLKPYDYRATVTIIPVCDGVEIGNNRQTYVVYGSSESFTATVTLPQITGYTRSSYKYVVSVKNGDTLEIKVEYQLVPDSIDIPITIVDYRADGLLFEFDLAASLIWGQLVANGQYYLSDAQNDIAGTTIVGYTPMDNAAGRSTTWSAAGGPYIRKGLVEEKLGSNGMPVYTDAAVAFVAKNLAAGLYKDRSANVANWNNIIADTFLTSTSERSVLTSTAPTSFSDAFAASKTYANITNAYDLAWYLLNTLYIPDQNTATVTDQNNTDKSYTLPIYGMAVDAYDKLTLKRDTDGSYYLAAYNATEIVYDEENRSIYNSGTGSTTKNFFYPINNMGYDEYLGDTTDTQAGETATDNYPVHPNGNYTLRGEAQFVYRESDNLYFTFTGDDDVYLFVNGQLIFDLGGAHWSLQDTVNLNDYAEQLGLVDGEVATFTFFYMERFSDCSNFSMRTNLTLAEVDLGVEKNAYDETGTMISDGSVVIEGTPVYYEIAVENRSNVEISGISITDTDSAGNTLVIGKTSQTDFDLDYPTYYPDENNREKHVDVALNGLGRNFTMYKKDADGNRVQGYEVTVDSLEDLSDELAKVTLEAGYKLCVRFSNAALYVGTLDSYSYTNNVTARIGTGNTASASHTIYTHSYGTETNVSYVVDFGLPLKLTSHDLPLMDTVTSIALSENNNPVYGTVELEGVKSSNGRYNPQSITLTYTPTKMLNGIDRILVSLRYKVEGSNTYVTFDKVIRIIPASIVYYEDDSFITFGEKGKEWEILGANSDAAQTVQKLGTNDAVYGYDEAYAKNSSMYSNGGVHKVTLASGQYATASFSFKGTGFDLVSLTGSTTGTLIVSITGKNVTRNILVDTYYGYKKVDGKWVVDETADGALYQIPVVKVDNLAYGEYTVKITASYNAFFDHTGDNQYDLFIDAVRIYNPLGDTGNTFYSQDGEGWPKFVELRDLVLEAWELDNVDTIEGAVFIDGDGANKDVANYEAYGPKNELYLAKGQAIAFYVNETSDPTVNKIELALKSANGNPVTVTVANADEVVYNYDIASSTDLYYAIPKSGLVIVTNTGTDDAVLSITNIKTTYTSDPKDSVVQALFTVNKEIADEAVAKLNAILNAPEVFTPEYMAVSVNRSSVREGGYVTVTVKTSADVAAVTVNGTAMRRMLTLRGERSVWTATVKASKVGELKLDVVAVNADNIASEAITETVTVTEKIEISGILEDIFKKLSDRWFR